MSEKSQSLTRRHFLRGMLAGGGVVAGSALLAACGGATQTTQPTAGSSGEAATAAPAGDAATAAPAAVVTTAAPVVAEKVELTHWDWWVTQSPWLDNEISLFQEANPGITINRTVQSGKYDELLQLAFKDNSAPDTFFSQLPFLDLVTNKMIMPYSDFSDFAEWQKTVPNLEISFTEGSNQLDGKTYAAPTEARSAWWNQIYVNTDVLNKYGITEVPKTMEQFLEANRKVTKDSNGEAYGFANPLSSGWTGQMIWYMGQLSGAPFGGDDFKTGRYSLSNPAYQKNLESFKMLKDEGLILPESSSIDDEGIRAMFAEGRAAFFTGGVWCVPGWAQTHPDFKGYTMMPPPLIDTNEPVSYFYTGPGQTGRSHYINANSKHADAAWTWTKWLNGREASSRWVTSGNGLSYWDEDNDPNATDNAALKVYFAENPKINRIGPARTIRNPDIAKVAEAAVKPSEEDVVTGIYSGQITDIPGTLAQLEKDKNAAREQAVADAVAAGAKVSMEDYAFPDWDPSKDYVTKAA